MKRLILLGISITITSLTFAQTQIGNAGFENWESVTGGTEPVNWNSFLTCVGSFSAQAKAVQCEQIAQARPGSAGTSCIRLWTRDTGFFGILANGNVTLGKINAGSASAGDANNNYNYSDIASANFSEAFTNLPDSIVFWVKYNASNGNSTARMKSTLHDNFACHDPEGTGGSASHIVGNAVVNFSPIANWTRMSVPFDYSIATSADANPSYILITFASNSTPGGGNANDEVFVDDVELIYNPTANQQMTANNDNFSGPQDNDIVCDVLANDTDPENMINASTVTVTTMPTNGSVAVDGGNGVITYTPNPGYSGADSFIYNVCDQGSPATCDQATVSISVNFTGIEENSITKLQVKSFGNSLVFGGADKFDGTYVVYNLTGEMIQKGKLSSQVAFNEKSGVYLVSVITSAGTVTKRIYKN